MPDRMPEKMSEDMLDRMPEKMSEDMPDRMLQNIYYRFQNVYIYNILIVINIRYKNNIYYI